MRRSNAERALTTKTDGSTPIQAAAIARNWNLVIVLAQSIIDGGYKFYNDEAQLDYALTYAVKAEDHSQQIKVVSTLLQAGARQRSFVRETENRVLHIAALCGNTAIVKLLLNSGADRTLKNKDNETAIQLAGHGGHWDSVIAIAENHTDARGSAHFGAALVNAVNHKQVAAVRALLNAKATFNWELGGDSVLHLAANHGNVEMITLLLQHGAKPNVRNNENLTPIEIAANDKKWDCVIAIAQHYFDRNRSAHFSLALFNAVDANHLAAAGALLEGGAITDLKTAGTGNTVLHFAVEKIYSEMTQLLLNYGASIAIVNNKGQTALNLASGSAELTGQLLAGPEPLLTVGNLFLPIQQTVLLTAQDLKTCAPIISTILGYYNFQYNMDRVKMDRQIESEASQVSRQQTQWFFNDRIGKSVGSISFTALRRDFIDNYSGNVYNMQEALNDLKELHTQYYESIAQGEIQSFYTEASTTSLYRFPVCLALVFEYYNDNPRYQNPQALTFFSLEYTKVIQYYISSYDENTYHKAVRWLTSSSQSRAFVESLNKMSQLPNATNEMQFLIERFTYDFYDRNGEDNTKIPTAIRLILDQGLFDPAESRHQGPPTPALSDERQTYAAAAPELGTEGSGEGSDREEGEEEGAAPASR